MSADGVPQAAAYRVDGVVVEPGRFYAIACDPARSVVVEACAGAGKTWMLVSRILRALVEGAQPHEILAITFTRKAAGEMRQRLSEWIDEHAEARGTPEQRVKALRERGVPESVAPLLAGALAGLQRRLLDLGRPVEIRTFHAWFAQLLRAAPLAVLADLQLPASGELIEGLDDHLPDIHRRFHDAVLRDPVARADHAELVAVRGRTQLRRWLDTVLHRRTEVERADAAGVLEPSVPLPAGGAATHPAERLSTRAWRESLGALAIELARGGKRAQDAAAGIAAAIDTVGAVAQLAVLHGALFTKSGTPRKLGAVAGLDELCARVQDLLDEVRQHEAALEHLRMVRLSRVLLAAYAGYKRERRLVDMPDLEHAARVLLGDSAWSGWVQERLDARVRHLLIDEFQDTGPLQWRALQTWLGAYAGAGGGASGQRPPGVFIVGDPKQSIYRFRRADPRIFAAAGAFVRDALGGVLLGCDHTRRNAPPVIEALNAVFAPAAAVGEFPGFRPHTTAAEPSPSAAVLTLPYVPRAGDDDTPAAADEDAAPSWRDSLTVPRHLPEDVLREREAAHVAAAIAALVDGERVSPGDVMVLCRKRESLRLVAEALRERQLPHAAIEERSLRDAPEARDLIALLDVLVSPQHRLSLAQVLRSPVFGASDADLVALAEIAGTGRDWWAALVRGAHASPALRRAAELLPRWREAGRMLPPHDVLDRILDEGDVVARYVAAVPPERRRLARETLEALVAQALALDAGRHVTPYGFVRALRRRALGSAAPVPRDAVQLLTVHGAKGLEADVVFVVDAEPETRHADNATLLVDWPVGADHPSLCAFVYSEARCAPSLRAAVADEQAARAREELNGLYVAMTRARHRLVLSATQPHHGAGAPGSWWERVRAHATPWHPPAPRRRAAAADGPIELRVLPTWRTRSEAPAAIREVAIDDAARLGQAVHRVMEWATGPRAGIPRARLVEAAATAFAVPAAEVARLAATLLDSAAASRFLGGPAVRWAGNEVPVSLAGQPGRIDRLVQLEEGGGRCWWVLDYKLQHRPQELPAYRAQLAAYRDAVQRLQPGDAVRAAFIAGDGSVLELDAWPPGAE